MPAEEVNCAELWFLRTALRVAERWQQGLLGGPQESRLSIADVQGSGPCCLLIPVPLG